MSEPRAVVFGTAGAAAALALALGCAEVSTAPDAVVSLGFDTSAVAIVVGDTLRDTLGRPLRLRATAFNALSDTVRGADISYVLAPQDTGVVRLVGDLAIGTRLRDTPARVFASAG